MYGVSGNNGLDGNRVEIFPPLRELQLRQFCTAAAFIDGPAWIRRKSDPRMRFAHAAPGMTNGMLGLR